MTNAQLVLNKIQETLCHEGTTYKGKSGTYMYILGRPTINGTINGVVHKLNDEGAGRTAGSFKILADGTVTRFTGIATKTTMAITSEIQSVQSEQPEPLEDVDYGQADEEESTNENNEAIAV